MTAPPATDGIAEGLLGYLRTALERPTLAYLQPPTPVSGGYDTRIFAFQLKGSPPDFSGRLIARVFRVDGGERRAARECALQNAVAASGYPAPRALLCCTDASVIGSAFMIMPRLAGQTLLDAAFRPSPMLFRAAGIMANAHARLHALDPVPIIQSLEKASPEQRAGGTTERLAALRQIATAPGLEGMLPGIAWLEANLPPEPTQRCVLHLDFHPSNILVENGIVTGVIDWANEGFGDPATDVAATMVILTMGPVRMRRPCGGPWAGYGAGSRGDTCKLYRQQRDIPEASLRYYEALRCYRAMLMVAANRAIAARGGKVERQDYPWGAPEQVRLMTGLFKRVTRVPLMLPPE